MATKSISQLDTQATANETDLFEVAIVDANSASGYASKKESAAAIADAIVGSYQFPLRITGTTAKTIAGAINELKNLVDLLPQFAIEVVNTLPVSDISETTIYLVPASDPEQGNYYEEYIYVNNAWELVGTTAVDLSGYYTSAQVDTLLAAKANTSSLATVATSGAYSDLSGKPTIDTALDDTSTNAVENRAVAGAIEEIESELSSPDTSDNEPYLLRDSASGTADRMVDELVGGTVAWNQLVENGDFADTSAWSAIGGNVLVSLNISGGKATVTLLADNSDSGGVYQTSMPKSIGNHVVLAMAKVKPSAQTHIAFNVYNSTDGNSQSASVSVNANTNTAIECLWRIGSRSGVSGFYVYINKSRELAINDTVEVDNVQFFDLTQMFGATIANYIYSLEQAEAGAGVAFFRKLFPEDYYTYNAGELISVKATAHKMRDASDNIIGNYPLDANLELRGLFKLDANNKLYCDGDTYESSGKVTRKYGIVDLGDLTWYYTAGDETHINRFNAILSGIKLPVTSDISSFISGMICNKLETNISPIGTRDIDNTICKYTNSNLYAISSAYSSAADFKTAMSGVYLVYELDTPTTETAASFAGIQVVDGDGTEEYVDSRSVPIPVGHNTTYIHGLNEYRTAVESYLASLDARITALENASSSRSLSVSPVLTKSIVSDSDTTEGKTEETEEETKEEAQNER